MKHALAVTTTSKFDDSEVARARQAAARWRLPYVARKWKAPLAPMLAELSDAFLVFDSQGVILRDAEGELRFSPGMAHLRVERFDAGERDDLLCRYAELREGDSFLDCTLGLAGDSLMAARAVGRTGRVVGMEKSQALYAVVSEGLARHEYPEASARIEALHADAAVELPKLASRSFDVVFFDPMFERPRKAAPGFDVLRRYADHAPLTPELLEEARRVARRWVVVKGSRYSQDLRKLSIQPLRASRSATTVFGRVAALSL